MQDAVRKPTCFGCPHELHYNDPVPTKQFGVMMHIGERFCIGGKRARRFKGSDPKFYVPSWCPKRKSPCEVRIYTLKSARDRFLHDQLAQDLGHSFSPDGHRYALRAQTRTQMTPKEFWTRCSTEPCEDLLDIPVHCCEVVEIDDGLKPVFFYRTDWSYSLAGVFNAETAKRNKLEGCD